ncbi:MAG: tRNA-dihydrouridine synthase [Candidatus Pacebacteria bacterium]|nr:tRNA-dihydrouridine synthase [Candidatus Paceibacterota bacterium]
MYFWQKLPKPFFTVAPMADVTDAAFRRMIAKYSGVEEGGQAARQAKPAALPAQRNPFVTWTEFVAADGLVRATPEGREKLMADLIYSDVERPIVAQLFTSNPEHMEYAAKLVRELGYNGIDINMGCPDKSIEKQGCGSAMIKTPALAKEIIRAAKRGAGDIPVSVKTRVGYYRDELEEWLPALLEEAPAAVTVHARTRQEMSKVPAEWERVKRAVEIRNKMKSEALIIGNGDVLSLEDGRRKASLSAADGIMVGRALFGNPWFFHPTKRLPVRLTALPTHGVDRDKIHVEDTSEKGFEYITLEERLRVMVEHTKLFEELLPHKNFATMKKHYKAYVNSFPGAAELRAELMEQNSATEVERVVESFLEVSKKVH